VTQIGEGADTAGAPPRVLTFGAPTLGEVLAERYQLEEHVNNDYLGRQLWRGMDVVLRRPVAVVLRYPGGEPAGEMLSAAVAASRIVHPHLVGVYDAIDEGERAYVVREWVEGASLRELVAEGAFDADRAAAVAYAVADAVAAIHATGMAHGNIHPGTVLVALDGRVMLTDARADEAATPESDIRAIGAVLYCALTAHWPHAEAGPTAVPDGVRDVAGTLAAPRQVRSGVPAFLDELTMYLLSPNVTLPTADVLVAELGRMEHEGGHPLYAADEGAVGFEAFDTAAAEAPERPRRAGRKILLGVAGLAIIAALGLAGAIKAVSSGGGGTKHAATKSSTAPAHAAGNQPTAMHLAAGQVRIIDGPGGSRSELGGADKTVDGDLNTGWKTEHYRGRADFGGLKPGMGILLDLGSPKPITSVQVQMSAPGATIELREGQTDPGSSAAGDAAVVRDFTTVGEPKEAGSSVILPGQPDPAMRYVLIWITKLPVDSTGQYQVGIQEITVFVG
jgi:eukaryotic-like serine/threonine-protein kinase